MTTSVHHVPYVDIKAQHAKLKNEILEAISLSLDEGDFVLGSQVEQFEKAMAEYCGVQYAIGVNSGTDALFLAMKAYGIGEGDEVITAPNSFLATASAIVATGARPVFVDIREDLNINPDLILEKVTKQTKAIIPVHLTGKMAEMDVIKKIATDHNLFVIEDAAQAIGAIYKDQKAGALAHAGCFSLHPLKTLNACGDGGVITTNDETLYDTTRQLRNIGLKNRNESEMWGYNSRLDNMQAAILLVKLKYLNQWIQKRRANAAFLAEQLKDVVEVPSETDGQKDAYHTFVIKTDQRDALQQYLEEHNVGAKIHYPVAIHLQKAAEMFGHAVGDFPVCERQIKRILSLPIHQELEQDDLNYIVECVKNFFRKG